MDIRNLEYPGTIGRGRLSGSTFDEYNRTIYFDEKCMPDVFDNYAQPNKNDTLYLLFLVDEETEYEATDFVSQEHLHLLSISCNAD